jgi:hypothetical protein
MGCLRRVMLLIPRGIRLYFISNGIIIKSLIGSRLTYQGDAMKLHGLTPVVSLISSVESAEAIHPLSLFELRRP